METKKRYSLGITLFLSASLFMAFMGATVKALIATQTTSSIVFWRNLIGLALIFPWILLRNPHERLITKLTTHSIKLQIYRGVTSFLSVFLYFTSLNYLDLSSATLLFNTIPIFVPIVFWAWKRIPIYHSLWWGIGTAFAGIILVLGPGKTVFAPASMLALLSGIIGAVSFVSLRLGRGTEPQPRMMFYLFLICMILAAIAMLFSFDASWKSMTRNDALLMLLVGVFGFFYQLLLTAAAKHVPMRLGSVFIYFSVIFASLLDLGIWHTEIAIRNYFGFLLIVAGAALIVLLYPKEHHNS